MAEPRDLPERPPHETSLEPRIEGEEIVIEPEALHGVKGFTITLSRDRANALGHKLIGLATRLRDRTVKT